MTKCILILTLITLPSLSCEKKYDREVAAYPTRDELVLWKDQFKFISLVKIIKRGENYFFELNEVIKGHISKDEFDEFIPQVDNLANPNDTFVFMVGENEQGSIVKLLAIQNDEIRKVGEQHILFKGYGRDEILKILKPVKPE